MQSCCGVYWVPLPRPGKLWQTNPPPACELRSLTGSVCLLEGEVVLKVALLP